MIESNPDWCESGLHKILPPRQPHALYPTRPYPDKSMDPGRAPTHRTTPLLGRLHKVKPTLVLQVTD